VQDAASYKQASIDELKSGVQINPPACPLYPQIIAIIDTDTKE